MVILEALEIGSKVKWVYKRFAAESGEVGVERIECAWWHWMD